MSDIPATYGELEFSASRAMRRRMKMPKKGWYIWPATLNSLEALMADALIGPYEDEEEAAHAASTQCFEAVPKGADTQ